MIISLANINFGGGSGGGGSTTVIDNLQSTSTTAALSANQGRVLNEIKADTTAVTESLKTAQKTWTATTVSDMNALTGISEGDVCVVTPTGTTYGFVEDQAMNDFLSSATTGGIYQGLYEIYGNQASGWTKMKVTTVENPYYNAGASYTEDTFGSINFTISGIENEPEYDPSWGGTFSFEYYESFNQFNYYNGAQGYISTGVTQIFDLVSPGVAPSVSGNLDMIMDQGNQLVLDPANQKLPVAFKIEFYKEVTVVPKTFQYNNGEWVELASKGYVDSSLTAYTPTSGFSTINGSAITTGDNIVIAGGGSDFLPLITTLPESPEDGAVYNYNGTLIKYVNGPGNWGEWFGGENASSRPNNAPLSSSYLYYGVLPNSVDGMLICAYKYISTYRYCAFNLSGNTIDVYDNEQLTGTPVARASKNAQSETVHNYLAISWNEHQIQFRKTDGYVSIPKENLISISASTAHYELVNRPEHSNFPFGPSSAYTSSGDYSSAPNYTVRFDKDGNVVAPGIQLTSKSISINNTSTSSNYSLEVLGKGAYVPGALFAPTTSGASGTLCVSQGNNAPQWQTVTQALGVDFWVGTEAQYEALAPSYSPTTLYFIKDE